MSSVIHQLFRFMFMGGGSTLLMLGIYILLTYIVNFQIAYFISYVITVIILYLLNSFYVFKNRLSFKTFFSFSLVYVGQYAIGAILLEVFVRLGFSVTYSPLYILLLLLPLTFIVSRLVMVNK